MIADLPQFCVVLPCSCADSNLIALHNRVSPCRGFFRTTRTTRVSGTPLAPRIRHFQSSAVTAKNGGTVLSIANLIADCESGSTGSHSCFTVTIRLPRLVITILGFQIPSTWTVFRSRNPRIELVIAIRISRDWKMVPELQFLVFTGTY